MGMDIREAHEPQQEFRLDNAAKIFPSLLTKQQTTIFRLSANIDKAVNIKILEESLSAMLVRCPYYRVHLRRGLFWYYLEPCDSEARIEAESRYPCLYLPYKKPGVLPFRVLAYQNRIAFEIAHFITDGTGALNFLNGLLLEYLRRRGEKIDPEGRIIECTDPPDPKEGEDSFRIHYEKGVPQAKQLPPALQLRGKQEKPPIFHVTEGKMESADLKREASRYGATIGEFLTALLIDVAQEVMVRRKLKPRPIRISIPINLRKVYPSITMRNFALSVEPGIDPRLGDFQFGDIVAKVHHFMKMEFDQRMIRRQLARNIEGEKNPFVRIIPLLFKDPLLRHFYGIFGRKAFTLSFSNLGRIQIPEQMKPFIKGYQFLPPPLKQSVNATSVAYAGKTSLFITSTVQDRSVERLVYTRLRKMGIRVSVTTNRR
jgi:hypothetical protein